MMHLNSGLKLVISKYAPANVLWRFSHSSHSVIFGGFLQLTSVKITFSFKINSLPTVTAYLYGADSQKDKYSDHLCRYSSRRKKWWNFFLQLLQQNLKTIWPICGPVLYQISTENFLKWFTWYSVSFNVPYLPVWIQRWLLKR